MANVVEIAVKLRDEASQGINEIKGNANGLSASLTNMRGPLLAVTGSVAGLGGASIKFASDLNEARSAMEQTFGGSSAIISKFAEEQADAFNVSQRAAFEYTAQIGGILKASGLAGDAAAGMSVDIVKLAADLASFKNISFDEALLKIRSGLVGEAEPLRTVGVLLSAAEVEAKALEMGLGGLNGELTEGEKVQARYALILEQTSDAQGDVARTADSVANRMRDVQQKSEDAAATWGQALLPVSQSLLSVVSGLIGVFSALPVPVQNVITVGALLAGALAAVGLVLPGLITGVTTLIGLAPLLGTAITAATGPFGLIALGIAAVIAAGILLITHWDEVKSAAASVAGWVQSQFEALVGWFGNVFSAVMENNVLKVAALFTPAGPLIVVAQFKDQFIAAFVAIRDVVAMVVQFVVDRINELMSAVGKAKDALGSIPSVGDVAGMLPGSGSGAADAVGGLLGKIPGFASGGVVPGPLGQPTLAVVHGGETVVPPGGGGGSTAMLERELAQASAALRQAGDAAAILTEMHERLAEAERKREQELLGNAQGAAGFAQRIGATSLNSQAAIASMFGFAPPELNVTVP